MLGDGDAAPGEGDVVIRGEECNQAEYAAADRLREAEAIETGAIKPAAVAAGLGVGWRPVWRSWCFLAAGRRPGGRGACCHGAGAVKAAGGCHSSVPPVAPDRLNGPGGKASPIDWFPGNRWRLNNRRGNVWEWCCVGWITALPMLPLTATTRPARGRSGSQPLLDGYRCFQHPLGLVLTRHQGVAFRPGRARPTCMGARGRPPHESPFDGTSYRVWQACHNAASEPANAARAPASPPAPACVRELCAGRPGVG